MLSGADNHAIANGTDVLADGSGPGQQGKVVMGFFQRTHFRLRDFMEKKAITME